MNKTKTFVAALLVLCILSVTALGATGVIQATLNYRGIKITLNGETVEPKDVNGNSTEPFIYDGTTYLPIRAVGDALNLDVGWDDATSTVSLTSGPEHIYPLLGISKQNLDAGSMFIYDFGSIKLHAYITGDSMGNAAYIVEGETGLVGIEMPAFPENLEAWKQYVDSLGKPMNDVFVSSHPAGGSLLEGKNIYGTKAVQDSSREGATYSRAQRLSDSNNLNFNEGSDIAQVNKVIDTEYLTVVGITFRIIDHGGSYDVAIPAIRVICPHQRINNGNHPTLTSIEAIDTTLDTLRGYLASDYSLIFSAHGGPEGQDAIIERVYYLNTAKALASSVDSAEDFISAMQQEFPDYGNIENLNTSAGNLFK